MHAKYTLQHCTMLLTQRFHLLDSWGSSLCVAWFHCAVLFVIKLYETLCTRVLCVCVHSCVCGIHLHSIHMKVTWQLQVLVFAFQQRPWLRKSPFFKKKPISFIILYVNVLAACISVHYIHTVSETGVANSCEPPSECWDLNSDPLVGQQVLKTIVPSLHPVIKLLIFYDMWKFLWALIKHSEYKMLFRNKGD